MAVLHAERRLSPAFLAISILAPDLSFEHCPLRSGSGLDWFKVTVDLQGPSLSKLIFLLDQIHDFDFISIL